MNNTTRIKDESRKLYGIFIGEIVSKPEEDSEKKRNRYRVMIHGVTPINISDKDCLWAEMIGFPMQGKKKSTAYNGTIEKGTFVYIQFLQGDINFPLIMGIAHGNKDQYDWFKNDISGFETKSGHQVIFNDKEGKEDILIKHGKKETKINFDKDGNLNIDVEKDVVIKVKEKAKVEIGKNATIDIKENVDLSVGKDAKIKIEGKADITTNGETNMKASKTTIKNDVVIKGKLEVEKDIKASSNIDVSKNLSVKGKSDLKATMINGVLQKGD